jgi:hypothetical protein
MKSEREIETEIINYLNSLPYCEAFKFPRGGTWTRKHTIRHSGQGVSDIICNYSYLNICWVIYFEVKKDQKQKPRESQIVFGERIKKMGGFWLVTTSVAEAAEQLAWVESQIKLKCFLIKAGDVGE